MELDDFKFSILREETQIPPFRCKDADLNSFLLEDAKKYLAELMAVTYVFVDVEADRTVAYFSLLNDKVAYDPRNAPSGTASTAESPTGSVASRIRP